MLATEIFFSNIDVFASLECGLASEMMCRIHDAVVQELKVDSINLYVRVSLN